MSERNSLQVMAAAVIQRIQQGRQEILIGRNPAEPYKDKWAFPCGPVERGESPEDALRRALRTLLGCVATIKFGQPPIDLEYDGVMCRWRFFFCEGAGSKIANHHFAETRWVLMGTLREYDFDPVSTHVVDWLLEEDRE
jgi:hypothetical protein